MVTVLYWLCTRRIILEVSYRCIRFTLCICLHYRSFLKHFCVFLTTGHPDFLLIFCITQYIKDIIIDFSTNLRNFPAFVLHVISKKPIVIKKTTPRHGPTNGQGIFIFFPRPYTFFVSFVKKFERDWTTASRSGR